MDRAEPVSTSLMDITNGGVFVKGEEEVIDRICFEDEEEIVEREIKRPLTVTPEEFAAPEQRDTQSSQGREGPKTLAGWRYRIKKALLDKLGRKYDGLYMCPGCLERKKLRLIRVNRNGDNPGVADYILLCDLCKKKREEEQKKTRLWTHKPSSETHKPPRERKGTTKQTFYNSIRELVFERDKNKCVFCEALGKAKYEEGLGETPGLGLAPLIPQSQGGKECFDNYVVSCAFHRASKGDELPLNYIFEKLRDDYLLSKQFDDFDVVVKNPGGRISIPTHTFARVEQFLMRRIVDKDEKPKVRREAEKLQFDLSKRDEDRRKEREQLPW